MKYSGIIDTIRDSDKALRVHTKLKIGRQDHLAADILELLEKKYQDMTLGTAIGALEIARITYLYKDPPAFSGEALTMAQSLFKDLFKLFGPARDVTEIADACDTARWWLIFIASIIPDQPISTG